MKATPADIKVHKVAMRNTNRRLCQRMEQLYADRQAAFANQFRPHFFETLWRKHREYKQLWKRRAEHMTQFQKAIADQDCCDANDRDQEVEQEVSQIEFVWSPNPARLADQLEPWVDNEALFSHHHDSHFRSMSAQFFHWIIVQESSASHMRNVSLIELFVAFRLSRPGCEPVVKSDGLSKYSVVTFAADFTYFKTIVRNLFRVADIPWGETVVLAGVGIVAPQFGVQCGWPADISSRTLNAICDFVGARPIVSSQSLAKPWHPCMQAD